MGFKSKIWDLVEYANTQETGLACRYVHIANFENAHGYNLLSGKDKPLQAYKFVQTIKNREGDVPDCLKWLDDYMKERKLFMICNILMIVVKP